MIVSAVVVMLFQATPWLGGYWNFNEFTNDVVKVQATPQGRG